MMEHMGDRMTEGHMMGQQMMGEGMSGAGWLGMPLMLLVLVALVIAAAVAVALLVRGAAFSQRRRSPDDTRSDLKSDTEKRIGGAR